MRSDKKTRVNGTLTLINIESEVTKESIKVGKYNGHYIFQTIDDFRCSRRLEEENGEEHQTSRMIIDSDVAPDDTLHLK